jgi:prepilin-type processing-associated H-X9-DG protein
MTDLSITGPANVFVVLDEQADSISAVNGDATYSFNPGAAATQEVWRDLPASYHNGAGSLSFADGHSEIHKWLNIGSPGQTVYPVLGNGAEPWATGPTMRFAVDFEWMQDRMPYGY